VFTHPRQNPFYDLDTRANLTNRFDRHNGQYAAGDQ